MSATSSGGCPVPEALERYVAEGGDSLLAEHVSSCASCQRRAAEIRENNEVADEVARLNIAGAKPGQTNIGESIPGYQIEAKIHHGGQGVVYRALQISTKRTVALKIPLEGEFASPRHQKRFEREVELVSELRHPNIVTLYESGLTSDGRRYFAMEYVDGVQLDAYVLRLREDSVGKQPVDVISKILRVFLNICRAIQYAHQRGVIHRDLKPSNILVDAQGNVHVVDFGLAKTLGVEDLAATRTTRTGEFMGTLVYAAPEQVEGKPTLIDTRTDVYSLGVVLYELLCGRLPYAMTGNLLDDARRVVETEAAPLSHASHHIDEELSAIVFKALAKDSDRRYSSAGDLGADIEHYLDGEPIQAKQGSTRYILRKTLRRYRLHVTAAAVLVLLVFGFGISMFVLYTRARAAEHAERLAREDAVRRFDQVRELTGKLVGGIHDAVANLPGATAVRKEIVETALADLDTLSADSSGNRSLMREVATAYAKLGDVLGLPNTPNLGDEAAALKNHEKALELRKSLVAAEPTNVDYLRDLATSYNQISIIANHQKDYLLSLKCCRESLAIDQRLYELAPDDFRRINNLAVSHQSFGDMLAEHGQNTEALAHFESAEQLFQQWRIIDSESAWAQGGLAASLDRSGNTLVALGRPGQATPKYQEALELYRLRVKLDPNDAWAGRAIAITLEHLADAQQRLGLDEAAIKAQMEAIQIHRELGIADKENIEAQLDLASSLYQTGKILIHAKRSNQAEPLLTEALEISKALDDEAELRDLVSAALNECDASSASARDASGITDAP